MSKHQGYSRELLRPCTSVVATSSVSLASCRPPTSLPTLQQAEHPIHTQGVMSVTVATVMPQGAGVRPNSD